MTDNLSTRPGPASRWSRAIMVAALVFVLVGGVVIGRMTAPTNRAMSRRPPVLKIQMTACRQVPVRQVVEDERDPTTPAYVITIDVHYRSGWVHRDFSDQGVAASIAFRPPSNQSWNMRLDYPPADPNSNSFGYYGFYSHFASHHVAVRWQDQMAADGNHVPFHGRKVMWLEPSRNGAGTISLYGLPNSSSNGNSPQYGPVQSANVAAVIAFFDVDGSVIERAVSVTCHPAPGAVWRPTGLATKEVR